jgi:uncharacterized RDD family membrane protein YckC
MKRGLAGPSPSEVPSRDPRLDATVDHTPSGSAKPDPGNTLPEPGDRFGDYQIIRTLGKGGMGAVFEADQLDTGRRVALKVLKQSLDSPEARKRFLREGRLAASVNHPNSVYVYGTEEIQGTPAIAMELVAGGTLQEMVKQRGALPIGEAVDVILQIIGGLEAAQKLGVLHRDIKPANCFVDIDGSVKVGDFGLSISTAPRGDTDVTQAGSFLGTPAFSSPEQLRGDELNVRSDMYSVGVTLHYLLTGRTPFDADNMVKLLATVLEKPAESPRKWRPEVPAGLATVVLRCLQKQPTDRFRDYDELRQALSPFASTAPTPGTLGLRFLAMMIDNLVLAPIVMICEFLLVPDLDLLTEMERGRGLLPAGLLLGGTLFRISYFGLLEGLWGVTLGKWICRLRVVDHDRMPPGIPRAWLRAAILLGLASFPSWLRFALPFELEREQLFYVNLATMGIMVGAFALARRANGFAALHDWLTGTRVVTRETRQTRSALGASMPELAEVSPAARRIGPYYILNVITECERESWILAYDTRLLRRIWIHCVPIGTPPVSAAMRNLGRIGRLRWLTGARSETENWDAFEAVTGQSLPSVLNAPLPWEHVRYWLLDLAEELSAAAKDDSLPEHLDLERVWITGEGRAKLLDFPAPGSLEVVANYGGEPSKGASLRFLHRVAVAATTGHLFQPGEFAPLAPDVPLPVAARELIQSLPQADGVEQVIPALRDLTRSPAHVSRQRRLMLLLVCCLPGIVLGLLGIAGVLMNREWHRKHPQIAPLKSKLITLRVRENLSRWDTAIASKVAAQEQVIAHEFSDTISDPAQWSTRYAKSTIDGEYRERAEQIIERYPQVSQEDYLAALGKVKDWQPTEGDPFQRGPEELWFLVIPFLLLGWLVWMAIFSVLAAVTFRRGLLLRGLGIDIVTNRGEPASRGLLLARSLITWSPLIVLPVAMAFVTPLLTLIPGLGWGSVGVTAALGGSIYLVVSLWSALMPHRGISDRLARTWLVPR